MPETPVAYRNYEHYIREGWAEAPKQSFLRLEALLRAANPPPDARLLDVGCATGELIHFLATAFPGFQFTGVDVFEPLLDAARRRLPQQRFLGASALDLPPEMTGSFELVTAIGVMSIFDDTELLSFLDNLIRVARPGGRVLILAPLNEYGVDCIIRHRKRLGGQLRAWETGWNIHSQQTLAELLQDRCRGWRFHPFQIEIDLERREDPVRTWTIRTEAKQRQLTNGLKLLIDHYFIEIDR
jgi:SAM-dependent methyltransferase